MAVDMKTRTQAPSGGTATSPQGHYLPSSGFPPSPVLDCLADGILATNAARGSEQRIVYANQAVCEITGYDPDELLGNSPKMLQGPETDPAVMQRLRRDLESGAGFNGQTVNYRKNGEPFVMEWSISTLVDASGNPAFHVAVQRDATLPARRLLQAERKARTDPLTGLPNRTHIDDVLSDGGWLTTRARSAVVADIDHFKQLNDTYGHLVGDEVLRLVARRMASAAEPGELVARWGGEEFCVLTLGKGEDATVLAQKIVAAVAEKPFQTSAGPLAVTISAGSASLTDDCRSALELLRRADRAMYEAKRSGRNRACSA